MSTIVIHNRPSLLRRILTWITISIIASVILKHFGFEPPIQALWETLKEVVPAFLDGVHTTADAIRSTRL